jgi:hypothetical protein
VDINDESVEIAKLSLWLRTAQRGRKLTTLNNNIKCGNSLIDDPEVAGEKAFNWQQEFPQVFEKGGFDVVIGNPPYVDIKALEPELVKALFKSYRTTENRINLYSIFIEKGFDIIKSKGYLSFINPNSILVNSSYTKIRKLLLEHMTTIVKLPDGVFEDAIVETIIFEFRKNTEIKQIKTIVYPKELRINYIDDSKVKFIDKEDWKKDELSNYNIYVNQNQFQILSKMSLGSFSLEELADFSLGITPYDKYRGHSEDQIKSRVFHSNVKKDNTYQKLISGGNISRYFVSNEFDEYISYGNWLGAPREERFFTAPRILVRQIVSGKPPRIFAGYTDETLYYTQIGFGIIPKENTINLKVLLGLINSNLINFFHKYSFLDLEKELFQKVLIANCKKFPINKNILISNLKEFEIKVDSIILFCIQFNLETQNFIKLLQSKFEFEKLSTKLQNWHELEFKDFLKELTKAKVKLSLSEEAEWMQYFNEQKQKAQQLKSEINKTDIEIDQMVYELYELTEEEIKIVEESSK